MFLTMEKPALHMGHFSKKKKKKLGGYKKEEDIHNINPSEGNLIGFKP